MFFRNDDDALNVLYGVPARCHVSWNGSQRNYYVHKSGPESVDGWMDRETGGRAGAWMDGQVRHLSMICCETAKFQLGADFPEHVSVLNRIYRIVLTANIE